MADNANPIRTFTITLPERTVSVDVDVEYLMRLVNAKDTDHIDELLGEIEIDVSVQIVPPAADRMIEEIEEQLGVNFAIAAVEEFKEEEKQAQEQNTEQEILEAAAKDPRRV